MIRYECLELLASQMSDQLVVTSQSGQRIEWSHLSGHEGNLLVGMMGCAIGVATGLALALSHRKVIALDSDGSVLLSLFNFNLGVELGQAMVVAVALPALALLRNTRWVPRMVWGSSLAILLVGVILFVERVLE